MADQNSSLEVLAANHGSGVDNMSIVKLTPDQRAQYRIVIVENNPLTANLIRETYTQAGYTDVVVTKYAEVGAAEVLLAIKQGKKVGVSLDMNLENDTPDQTIVTDEAESLRKSVFEGVSLQDLDIVENLGPAKTNEGARATQQPNGYSKTGLTLILELNKAAAGNYRLPVLVERDGKKGRYNSVGQEKYDIAGNVGILLVTNRTDPEQFKHEGLTTSAAAILYAPKQGLFPTSNGRGEEDRTAGARYNPIDFLDAVLQSDDEVRKLVVPLKNSGFLAPYHSREKAQQIQQVYQTE